MGAAGGCGTGRDRAPAGAGAAPPPVGAGATADAGSASATVLALPPVASEVEAREVLRRHFREAGLRVISDVRLHGDGYDITVDGYDPDRKIGFEYVASDEVNTDVAAGEREALAASDNRVLLVDATSAAALTMLARAFLGRIDADAGLDRSLGASVDDE